MRLLCEGLILWDSSKERYEEATEVLKNNFLLIYVFTFYGHLSVNAPGLTIEHDGLFQNIKENKKNSNIN